MKLQFQQGGSAYSAAGILEFTKSGQTDFWREPFFRFYPDVDRDRYNAMTDSQRLDFLQTYFAAFAAENRALLEEKHAACQTCWDTYEPQIVSALEDVFQLDLKPLFNDLVCRTTFNPISPRFLNEHTFDHFYLESERGALGTAIHEIIHFVWFHVWQDLFHDDVREYETPHLKWILSEMVVEPIMRDGRLGPINPYYTHRACVYPYFYTMALDGTPVLDTLYDMLRSMPIRQFMAWSYEYCTAHEPEIRAHIEKSERGG